MGIEKDDHPREQKYVVKIDPDLLRKCKDAIGAKSNDEAIHRALFDFWTNHIEEINRPDLDYDS